MLSDHKLYARIADSVLDDKDFGVICFGLRDGRVVEQQTLVRGVQGAPDLIGMSEAEVLDWTRLDTTGQHPETYHELAPTRLGPWSSFCSTLPVR